MITNTTEVTNNAATAAAAQDESSVDAGVFAQELQSQISNTVNDLATRMAEMMEKLASAFPGSTISNQKLSGFEQSYQFFASAGTSTIAVGSDMMEQMAQSDDLFAQVKELIAGLMEAGSNQNLVNAGGQTTSPVSNQVAEIRYVEVQRGANGTQLSASSLAMENQEFMNQVMEQIFAWRNGGSNSSQTGTGSSGSGAFDFNQLSQLFEGTNASNAWRMQGLLSMSTTMQLFGGSGSSSGSGIWDQLAGMRSSSFTANITIAIQQWSSSSGSTGASGTDFMAYMEMMGLYDPLVLDLGDEGINLTSAEDGVYFDMKGDGSPVQTAWISGNNAFLYLDENGNDIADDVNELFGNTGGNADGWAKLAKYDDNGDGVIDENDAIYSQLRLWRDLNGDGVNQKSESMTLAEAGIKSINLNHDNSKRRDANGNVIADQSYFTRADGTTGLMADAWLRSR